MLWVKKFHAKTETRSAKHEEDARMLRRTDVDATSSSFSAMIRDAQHTWRMHHHRPSDNEEQVDEIRGGGGGDGGGCARGYAAPAAPTLATSFPRPTHICTHRASLLAPRATLTTAQDVTGLPRQVHSQTARLPISLVCLSVSLDCLTTPYLPRLPISLVCQHLPRLPTPYLPLPISLVCQHLTSLVCLSPSFAYQGQCYDFDPPTGLPPSTVIKKKNPY